MDFFVAPTVRFQLLYIWFVIDHSRRRILHFNVTESATTTCWAIQQLRDAFPNEPAHRLILDNDAIFSPRARPSSQTDCVSEPMAERARPSASWAAFGGSFLLEYVDYYNTERVHTAIGDAPEGRESETRPSSGAKVVALPRVGGLHHRYTCCDSA